MHLVQLFLMALRELAQLMLDVDQFKTLRVGCLRDFDGIMARTPTRQVAGITPIRRA
jgi:hypothetical protein